ncbi:MAG: biotin/lipoyl-containing protein [bacterium]|jgi:biotin carboxyl carrier protein
MKKFRVVVNGTAYEVEVEEIGNGSKVQVSAPSAPPAPIKQQVAPPPADQPTPKPAAPKPAAPTGGPGVKVEAPMPGTILDIKVKVGDAVNAGDVLLILEAMKMENEIAAPENGTVQEILISKGASVNSGDVLVVLG